MHINEDHSDLSFPMDGKYSCYATAFIVRIRIEIIVISQQVAHGQRYVFSISNTQRTIIIMPINLETIISENRVLVRPFGVINEFADLIRFKLRRIIIFGHYEKIVRCNL